MTPALCDQALLAMEPPRVTGLAVSESGLVVVAAESGGTWGSVWRFDVMAATPELEKIAIIPRDKALDAPPCAWVSPDGRVIATDHDRTALLWQIEDGAAGCRLAPRSLLKAYSGYVCGVAFSRDSSRLIIGGDTGASIWDVGQPDLRVLDFISDVYLYDPSVYLDVAEAAFSADNSKVLVGYSGTSVRLWNLSGASPELTSAELDHRIEPVAEVDYNRCVGVALSADGRLGVSVNANGTAQWSEVDAEGCKARVLRAEARDPSPLGALGLGVFADGRSGWMHWRRGGLEHWRVEETSGQNAVVTTHLESTAALGIGAMASCSGDARWLADVSRGYLRLWRMI
jgi:hypothetical protein